MKFTPKNISLILFSLFLTFCIVNGMTEPTFHQIGQYGKVITLIFSLAFAISFFPIFRMNKLLYCILGITGLLMLFSFVHYSSVNNFEAFTYSGLFIAYLIFIFFIVRRNKGKYYLTRSRTISYNNKNQFYNLFVVFQKVLLINYFIWFIVAYVLNFSMYGQEIAGREGFGGFYGARMGFGLLSAVGFIISFYLLIQETGRKRKYQLILVIIFLFFVIFSESRTSIAICLFLTLHYYLNIRFRNFLLLLSLFFLAFFVFENGKDTLSSINDTSSGRSFIWDITLQEIYADGIFNGHGLYNLNDLVLDKYRYVNNFFEESDKLGFHSSYIELLAGGGLLALIIFLYVNLKLYSNSSKIYQSIQVSILFGAFFEGFIMSPNIPISLLYWTVIFIQITQLYEKEEIKRWVMVRRMKNSFK